MRPQSIIYKKELSFDPGKNKIHDLNLKAHFKINSTAKFCCKMLKNMEYTVYPCKFCVHCMSSYMRGKVITFDPK